MQDVHLICPLEQVRRRAEAYEQEFAEGDTVALIDWGCSYKKEQGYIVLEWDGEVDPDFLARLNTDGEIEDYCVYDVPCTEVVEEIAGSQSIMTREGNTGAYVHRMLPPV